jgi:hypothetical protein
MPNLRKMNMVAGRGEAPINFTSLGIGRHSKSVYNVVNRKVFPSKTYPDPLPEPAPLLLMVNQPISDTAIGVSSTSDIYQSFTATQSCKLKKFAFSPNGTSNFNASATVTIRDGEGITGTIMYSGTWANISAGSWNEYDIDSDVNLTNCQKYSIQLTNFNIFGNMGFLYDSTNPYSGGHSNLDGTVQGDLKMQIWVDPLGLPPTPAPTIATALAVNEDNTSATITFSEAVYKSDGSSALTASELGLTIASGTSTLTSYTVSTSDNTTFTFALTLAGTSDGTEVLTLTGTVYNCSLTPLAISTTVTFNDLTPLLMVNQLNTDSGVSMVDDMYQSFTATQSCKLKKFAFSADTTFSGSATIIIREGEGITGTNMYSDTWTIDTTASAAIVYDITTDVNLINGQKYSIQLTNISGLVGNMGLLYDSTNPYSGGHLSWLNVDVGDLKMQIWVL